MIRIDLLRISRPARACEVYLAEKPRFPILLLILPIACLLYFASLYVDHIIASEKAQTASDAMTVDERMQWSNLHEVVDQTLQANTVEDALRSLDHLRYCVGYLPYKDERHEYDANVCLDSAERLLSACYASGKTHPDFWRPELSNALTTIPTYAGRIEFDDTPPPPIVDEASLSYSGT